MICAEASTNQNSHVESSSESASERFAVSKSLDRQHWYPPPTLESHVSSSSLNYSVSEISMSDASTHSSTKSSHSSSGDQSSPRMLRPNHLSSRAGSTQSTSNAVHSINNTNNSSGGSGLSRGVSSGSGGVSLNSNSSNYPPISRFDPLAELQVRHYGIWLYIYIIVISVSVECYIGKPLSYSITSYCITSITHSHHVILTFILSLPLPAVLFQRQPPPLPSQIPYQQAYSLPAA